MKTYEIENERDITVLHTDHGITDEQTKFILDKVVDGDTIASGDHKIRLLGGNTPESVHPSQDVEWYGVEAANFLKSFLKAVIRDAVTYSGHARRSTVTTVDMLYALKRQGRPLYGFGG